jgi:N-acyl-D-aspartate/D-glutamate deacylase
MTDLVIRGGLVVDGSGAAPFTGDVAIEDGKITDVGKVTGRAPREINADGLVVTPGFVDPHTHFDGQATWDPKLAPSSQHGVTTVVMGNCGVGFAPARPDRHDWLIGLLEGVEDIPGTALAEGLPWDWESFPQYLDSLDRLPRTIDVGVQIPHAALRVYVMGERGADPHESPTATELDGMARRVGEGLEAGAIGFSTSRTENHRTKDGAPLGTLRAEASELLAIAAVMREKGKGVVQLISDCYQTEDTAFAQRELDLISGIARTSGRPLSYTVLQAHNVPGRFRELLSHIRNLRAEGLNVKGQMAPRPVGILLGLEASVNPFSRCVSYGEIAGLPLAERVAALRQPERRQRILAEHADVMAKARESGVMTVINRFESMYLLADPVDYDLKATSSLTELARAQGADPAEWVYGAMLGHGGTQLFYAPILNFADRNFGAIQEMITSPETLFGLSDAGAHCGAICDASFTTSYLTTWVRDRKGAGAIPLERVVHQLTRRPAEHIGWLDRGLLSPGYLADVNIIDFDGLGCRPPRIIHDLPAGGRRLVQDATGYRYTIKKGVPTLEDGQLTGEYPAGLLRGTRPAPQR